MSSRSSPFLLKKIRRVNAQQYFSTKMEQGNDSEEVTISLSDIHPSLLIIGLEQHFREFELKNVVVYRDAENNPTGTATITLLKSEAVRLMRKIAGVQIGGLEITFKLVNRVKRVSFKQRRVRLPVQNAKKDLLDSSFDKLTI